MFKDVLQTCFFFKKYALGTLCTCHRLFLFFFLVYVMPSIIVLSSCRCHNSELLFLFCCHYNSWCFFFCMPTFLTACLPACLPLNMPATLFNGLFGSILHRCGSELPWTYFALHGVFMHGDRFSSGLKFRNQVCDTFSIRKHSSQGRTGD